METIFIDNTDFYVVPENGINGFWDRYNAKIQKDIDRYDTKLKTGQDSVKNYTTIENLLIGVGIPENIIPWAVSMVLLESSNLTSPESKDNNFSNITYRAGNKLQAGPGVTTKGHVFARYQNMTDWAKDFKRVLSLHNVKTAHSNGGPAAIEAGSIEDFTHRLKVNGYFEENEGTYLMSMQAILKMKPGVTDYVKDQNQYYVNTPKGKAEIAAGNFWGKLKWYEKGGIILGGAFIIKTIFSK